jgi:hypothetical protein
VFFEILNKNKFTNFLKTKTHKIMKKLKLLSVSIAALFLASANSFAQEANQYKIDPNHTSVTWSANHFGFSNPSGKFSDIDGSITFDEKNPKKSEVSVTIKIASLNTNLPKFDQHLKSKDFFDAEAFPTATFVSKKVTVTGKNQAKVAGDFTLKGITKPVVLNVKFNKLGANPLSQKQTVGFSATAKIKRSEFGVNYALPNIADEVKLVIEAEANL